jgi:hypothetical protein
MKTKKFTHGVTIFMTVEMYQAVRKLSDQKQISLSELIRQVIAKIIEK